MKILDTTTLGAYIRNARKEQNLTQTDVATACGVGVRYIVDLENGKETCQIGKAIKIINTLGLNLDIL